MMLKCHQAKVGPVSIPIVSLQKYLSFVLHKDSVYEIPKPFGV